MDLTNAQRQAAYRARRAAQGIVQVQVFVHRSRRAEIRSIAAGMAEPVCHNAGRRRARLK